MLESSRRLAALQIQNNQEVAANDARNAAMRQQRLEDARAPFKEGEAPKAPFLPSLLEEGWALLQRKWFRQRLW